MQCYLINLDRSHERLREMEIEFSRVGLSFIRVPAVDGRSLSLEELSSVTSPSKKWLSELTSSEIGCFLSHKKCIELIATGLDEYGIVFEDDILFARDAGKLLSNAAWVPAEADIVKIETQKKKILTGPASRCLDTGYSVAPLLSTHILAAGYIISRSAARRLLSHMTIVSVPVDHLLFSSDYDVWSEMKISQVTPAPCIQAGYVSTLEDSRREIYCRPTLLPRLWREIKRMGARSVCGSKGLWKNCITRNRWGRIPFAGNGNGS